jgi:hypothetical protein
VSTVGKRPKPRIVGEHFRSDGSPKRRFPTQAAAERHAQRYHLNQDLYECSFCGGFHFATKRVWEKP